MLFSNGHSVPYLFHVVMVSFVDCDLYTKKGSDFLIVLLTFYLCSIPEFLVMKLGTFIYRNALLASHCFIFHFGSDFTFITLHCFYDRKSELFYLAFN